MESTHKEGWRRRCPGFFHIWQDFRHFEDREGLKVEGGKMTNCGVFEWE